MDDMARGDLKTLAHLVGAVLLVALVVGLGVVVWRSDSLATARAHDDAVARWDAREPVAYSFVLGYCNGMCASCPIRVQVSDGEVVDATALEPQCPPVEPEDGATVEDMFALEERLRSDWFPDDTIVSYDPVWGFPATIERTCGPDTSDCGTGWSVGDFTVVEPAQRSSRQPTSPST